MITTATVRVNCDQVVRTDAGEFMVNQRNEGYAENDGAWVVTLLPELYWSPIGVLRQRRAGGFIGVFDTIGAANMAIVDVERPPVDDRMLPRA